MFTSVVTSFNGTDRVLSRIESDKVVANLAWHAVSSVACISYVCLGCGSIGESESREARDTNASVLDFTCCGDVVTFRSV